MDLSDGILGITLLAWGNSIGGIYVPRLFKNLYLLLVLYTHTHADAVADITMARQGFPRMAVGACFGGPLLSILKTWSVLARTMRVFCVLILTLDHFCVTNSFNVFPQDMLLGIGLASTIKAISQPDLGFDVSQREGTQGKGTRDIHYIYIYLP